MFEESVKRVVKRGTMQEAIYADLRLSLMKGRFDPGQMMTIHALADAFGASTMPVREALRQLVAENGLSVQANGTIQVPAVSVSRLRDLCTARLALEGLATRMACERLDAATLRHLKRLIDEHEQSIEHDGIYSSLEKNQEFHFLIYAASGSSVLPSLIESLWLQYGPYMRVISRHVETDTSSTFQRNGTDYHHVLVTAFEKGDADAAQAAMEADIQRTTDLLLDVLAAQTTAGPANTSFTLHSPERP
ncbi:HTH-type transcriptional regulator McbR (plasmid) [Caballeronia sp. SBC1]|uniref:GntR family transcriptional regulator n=1 Tax=Caballeronia sp. SBC1 TaxID=2705548 RepID=UPI00140BB23C|nr:GntR family transcriptional regulator [Caballeronia sp. SBC1]QIN67935.1 HTH-type transcriptional regulator McbR [Caballeronia sp. SBC1]